MVTAGGVSKHMTSMKSGPNYRPTTFLEGTCFTSQKGLEPETYCAKPSLLTDKVKLVSILKLSLQGKAAFK